MKISCIRYTNRLLAMLSLTALLVIVVSSCNTSEIEVEKPSTGFVTVDLALNVSAQHSTTRLSADITQKNASSFRGLQDWTLIPFAATLPATDTPPVTTSSDTLPGIITTKDAFVQKSNTYYNYLDQTVVDAVIGTNAYLCYGRAERGTDNFVNGSTVASFGTSGTDYRPGSISFSPNQICSLSALTEDEDAKGTALLAYLNGIANASVTDGGTTYTWSSEGSGLEKTFTALTNYDKDLEQYRLFAGSSASIKALVTTIYNVVANLSVETGTWQASLKTVILNTITDDLTYTITTTDGKTEITITSLGTSLGINRDGFPANINLPDGVAAVVWNDTSKAFEFATPTNVATDYKELVYPAELWYYTNSPIKTSNTSQASYYDNTWNTVLGRYTDGTAVALSTRSIAIVNPLQYGVGCIEGVVQATSETLRDANYTEISLKNGTTPNFPLTAVLFGGQCEQKFDFTPKDDSQYILYDCKVGYNDIENSADINLEKGSVTMTETGFSDESTAKFYTLSLQTPDATDVKIVLEFQNNSGESFYGENGLIAPGMRFYLVGTVTAPTTGDLRRVVTQDYKTQLIINVESLMHAYNVIPDLNAAMTSLKVVDIGVAPWTKKAEESHPVYNW